MILIHVIEVMFYFTFGDIYIIDQDGKSWEPGESG